MSGRRNLIAVAEGPRSSDALGRLRSHLRLRPQQLHELIGRVLRLLPELGGEAAGQFIVEFRVPVVGCGFDGAAEFFFRPAEPSEPGLGILLGARLVVKGTPGPEMWVRALRRASGLVD